eukprot:548821-Hanusia_phi.AAC.4
MANARSHIEFVRQMQLKLLNSLPHGLRNLLPDLADTQRVGHHGLYRTRRLRLQPRVCILRRHPVAILRCGPGCPAYHGRWGQGEALGRGAHAAHIQRPLHARIQAQQLRLHQRSTQVRDSVTTCFDTRVHQHGADRALQQRPLQEHGIVQEPLHVPDLFVHAREVLLRRADVPVQLSSLHASVQTIVLRGQGVTPQSVRVHVGYHDVVPPWLLDRKVNVHDVLVEVVQCGLLRLPLLEIDRHEAEAQPVAGIDLQVTPVVDQVARQPVDVHARHVVYRPHHRVQPNLMHASLLLRASAHTKRHKRVHQLACKGFVNRISSTIISGVISLKQLCVIVSWRRDIEDIHEELVPGLVRWLGPISSCPRAQALQPYHDVIHRGEVDEGGDMRSIVADALGRLHVHAEGGGDVAEADGPGDIPVVDR